MPGLNQQLGKRFMMKLYELQKKCSPKSQCPLSMYCLKKEFSRELPACIIDMDQIEETVEDRKRQLEQKYKG